VIPGYAAYYLGHPEVRRYIVSNAVGATMPNLNTGLLSAVPFVLPPLHEQKAIAEVLSSLDDKIELNRRAIVTLETVAQAIFRDWFVDFGPVRRMHEGATNPGAVLGGLIPDPRLATELAKMFSVGTPAHQLPQGWERFQLSRIADIVKANINPQSQPEQVFEHYSLPAYDKGDDPTLDLGATIKSTKTCVSEGVVLLSKLNPEIERVWLVGPSGGRPQVASTEFLAFAPAPEITASLLYCLFRDPTFRAGLRGMATGTSKSHQRIQSAELLRKAVLAGRADAFKAFGGIADALLARSMGAKEENRTLSEIRDYLLPRLMSGKVRVTQAERRLG
jgi:type I restriction enzyme S subunit